MFSDSIVSVGNVVLKPSVGKFVPSVELISPVILSDLSEPCRWDLRVSSQKTRSVQSSCRQLQVRRTKGKVPHLYQVSGAFR